MVLKEMSRRQALALGWGCRGGPGSGVARAQDARELRRRPAEDLAPRQNIGIQLYSLRDMQAAIDFGRIFSDCRTSSTTTTSSSATASPTRPDGGVGYEYLRDLPRPAQAASPTPRPRRQGATT